MGNTLYLECYSGISGDMTVAALLDAGADREALEKALHSLPVHGYEVEVSRVKKAGLDACDFHVRLDKEHENHDHDMEYLHGHAHSHDQEHGHSHEARYDDETGHAHSHEPHPHDETACGQGHSHKDHHHDETACEQEHSHGHHHDGIACEQGHPHEHHPHAHTGHTHTGHTHTDHTHTGLREIMEIIEQGELSSRAKETAIKIFHVLAEAEAKAHGVSMEEVHFHEVGAVDSIVDIVAVAVCLDNLDITEVIVPFLCEGRGTVRCQHGILPVPVPAVANIVEAHRIPIRFTEVEGELVTPTGAAIVAAVKTGAELPKQFVINRIGIGAGKRNYERPSLLRAMLIQEKNTYQSQSLIENAKKEDFIYKLETNIDDCTGEALGYTMDKLMAAGARDVHFIPVYMKKSRPAYELAVICDEDRIKALERIIFRETTTIGIRRVKMDRTLLPRDNDAITLPEGELKVKKCTLPDGQERRYPEYDSVIALAEKSGKSFWQVMDDFQKSLPEDF